eukprot:TRINITY_DN1628_c0_g1_i1.p1 TRINITY_DN1628_c0_g1~~TRINITY_DN1628_c0_g1_i1.p1  ORF type:complete len:732 (+),score=265.89 TRINITY_DN1628_c0_g1_i1:161-2356(+)
MKFAFAVIFLLFASAAGHKQGGNPVSRVVGLLKDLSEKLGKEAKAEKELYEKFTCWGTTTVDEKTKSVNAAKERIEYLENYIKDIDSGAVWFTSEKETIEAEIAKVNATLNNNQGNRTEDHDKFLKEANATEDGIEGLDVGLDALADAAAPSADDPTAEALIALRGSKRRSLSSARERVQYTNKLRKALVLGQEYLDNADYAFMHDVVTGRVDSTVVKGKPDDDTKVIGQYKSRLGGVIEKLKDVQVNMEFDLKEDIKADHEAEETYEQRQATKEKEKAAAEALLAKLDGEYAARAKAKAESQEEIDALTEQNKEDEDLIAAATAQLEEKAKLWDQRLAYRTGEQEAIGKAIEILHSDEARDLFARSTSFVQVSSVSKVQVARAQSASKVLMSEAELSKNHRLLLLAVQLGRFGRAAAKGNPTFDIVLQKIDDMKAVIKAEGEADLQKKEDCEATRTEDEKTAKDHSNKIEDLKNEMEFLEAKIKDITETLAKKDAQIAEVNISLNETQTMRNNEKAEYESSKQDDTAAAGLLEQAAKVVQDFYDSQASFLQVKSKSKQGPDEAPEGMPDVFHEEYGGAGAQGGGVIQTMKMVEDDIRKEIVESDKAEKEAVAEFDATKKKLEAEKETLKGEVDSLLIQKGEAQDGVGAAKQDLGETEDLKKVVEKKMKEAEPECNWYFENIEVRDKNRETEMNGLDKAKAILNGAVFEDKSREIAVGDSLIAKSVKRHSF